MGPPRWLGCHCLRPAALLFAILCASAMGERPRSGVANHSGGNASLNSNASAVALSVPPSSALEVTKSSSNAQTVLLKDSNAQQVVLNGSNGQNVVLNGSKSGPPPEGYSAETFGEVVANDSVHDDGAKVIMYPRVHWQTRPQGPIHQVVNRLRMYKKHLESAEDQAREQASTYAATLRKLGEGIDVYRKGPQTLAESVQRHQNQKLQMVEQAIKEGGKVVNEEDFQVVDDEGNHTETDHTNHAEPVNDETGKKDSVSKQDQRKQEMPKAPKENDNSSVDDGHEKSSIVSSSHED